MAFKLVARPSGILVPRDDFGLKGQLDRDLVLGDDIGFVAALGLGFDGNQSRLLRVDKNGNLLITASSIAPAVVRIQDSGGVTQAAVQANQDGAGLTAPGIWVNGIGFTTDGAVFRWNRMASAANLAAQSGLGAALNAPPGNWAVSANGGLGAQTSGTRVAGGAGVRHVCTGYSFVISCQAAPAAGGIQINLRDGASGAGALLEAYIINLPAAIFQAIVVTRSGLSIVGSAATAMTLESTVAYAAVGVAANFEGYDAA